MIVIDDYVIFRLTFQFTPSSKVYGFSEVDLTPNGGDKVLIETLYKFDPSYFVHGLCGPFGIERRF